MFTKNDTLHCLKVSAELFELFLIDKFKVFVTDAKKSEIFKKYLIYPKEGKKGVKRNIKQVGKIENK